LLRAGINPAPTTLFFIDFVGAGFTPAHRVNSQKPAASRQQQIILGRESANFKQAVIETHDRKI
jgi:hypothetical protein